MGGHGLASHKRLGQENSHVWPLLSPFWGDPWGSCFSSWSDHCYLILAGMVHSGFKILKESEIGSWQFFHPQFGNSPGNEICLLMPKEKTATSFCLSCLHISFLGTGIRRWNWKSCCTVNSDTIKFLLARITSFLAFEDCKIKNYIYHRRMYVKILSALWIVTGCGHPDLTQQQLRWSLGKHL